MRMPVDTPLQVIEPRPAHPAPDAAASAAIEVRTYETPDDAARRRWAEVLAGQPFADTVFDWCEAARAVETPGFEVRYFEAWLDGRPQALAVLHVLRCFSVSKFMGGRMERFFDRFARLGMTPLAFDLGYLEMPLCCRPGLLFSDEAVTRGLTQEITASVLEAARRRCRCDVLFLKAVSGTSGTEGYDRLGLLKMPFFAETRLELPQGGFDAYERLLSANGRSSLRRNRKVFAAAGGEVSVSTAVQADGALLARLLAQTDRYHRERGEPGLPVVLGERYFRGLATAQVGGVRIYVARLAGRPVGFALALHTGGELFFTHCGLDHQSAESSRAYFNLYYAMVEDAMTHELHMVNLGPFGYEAKRRVGAQTVDSWYFVSMEKRWMKPLMKLFAWMQKRSEKRARRHTAARQ